jgi:soluble lytic murein transglycosylase-like protein
MMQLQLETARSMGFTGTARQLLDWQTNVTFGAKYLLSKLEEYGDIPMAISAYNAGRALVKWTRSTSLRRFVNHQYVRDVLAEMATIMTDEELKKILLTPPRYYDAPILVPATS